MKVIILNKSKYKRKTLRVTSKTEIDTMIAVIIEITARIYHKTKKKKFIELRVDTK